LGRMRMTRYLQVPRRTPRQPPELGPAHTLHVTVLCALLAVAPSASRSRAAAESSPDRRVTFEHLQRYPFMCLCGLRFARQSTLQLAGYCIEHLIHVPSTACQKLLLYGVHSCSLTSRRPHRGRAPIAREHLVALLTPTSAILDDLHTYLHYTAFWPQL
jgi:hypothetical protein